MMTEDERIDCGPEYLPMLEESLESAEEVSVRLDIKVNGGTLNIVFVDTTQWGPDNPGHAVARDASGNTCLVVDRNQDRIFNLALSPDWRWKLDPRGNSAGAPVTFKRGDPHLYRVSDLTDQTLKLHAKARPSAPKEGVQDFFNLYISLEQDSGDPIPVRIDPITQNPPPGWG